ncbi:MAG: F0F1 ATP synthase subunit A [Flavobacteriales bacterium]|nr:F0F1 ATP synthase subunit A [Flavobacteriales bacterium]
MGFYKSFSVLKAAFVGVALLSASMVMASSGGEGGEFNAGEMISHHIADNHDWHLIDLEGEDGQLHPISIPLPVILWHQGQGLQIFLSSKFHHGTESYNGYALDSHNDVYFTNDDGSINEAETGKIIDISITKNVVTMFIVSLLVILIFSGIARAYKRSPDSAPSGIQSFFEPLILFIRDEIAIAVIGKDKYEKFMPFLLSVFFFIWFGNMLGLVPFFPGGANFTGNIAVTMVIAACTLVLILVNSNKHYWQHVFAMPGVPIPVLFVLTPIEILGVFLKPIVLMIRLFANITAGHITILAFMSLIFIMGKNGEAPVIGWGTGVVSVVLSIIMTFLELLVAFLQAFIFTLLSATYFAGATEEAHH